MNNLRSMNFDDKIYIAEHRGLIGSAIVRQLRYNTKQDTFLNPHLLVSN